MLTAPDKFLAKAKQEKYAVPAPDFIDSSSARAYVEVSEEQGKPLILSYAEVHKDIISLEEAALIGKFYAGKVSTPIALHLDHGMSLDIVQEAVKLGFTSVMIDASMKEFSENIAISKEVVDYAHSHKVFVEAEIGHVGSGVNYENHTQTDSITTGVEDALEFLQKTGVDFLAVSIGTAHGLYKGTPKLDFQRLKELSEAIPIPLVLHGGSSSGDENLRRCAQEGISKINIFTDIMMGAAASIASLNPKDYISIQESASAGIKKVLSHYYNVFLTKK